MVEIFERDPWLKGLRSGASPFLALCRLGAFLPSLRDSSPFRVHARVGVLSQGSSFRATLGFESESLRDSTSLRRDWSPTRPGVFGFWYPGRRSACPGLENCAPFRGTCGTLPKNETRPFSCLFPRDPLRQTRRWLWLTICGAFFIAGWGPPAAIAAVGPPESESEDSRSEGTRIWLPSGKLPGTDVF